MTIWNDQFQIKLKNYTNSTTFVLKIETWLIKVNGFLEDLQAPIQKKKNIPSVTYFFPLLHNLTIIPNLSGGR